MKLQDVPDKPRPAGSLPFLVALILLIIILSAASLIERSADRSRAEELAGIRRSLAAVQDIAARNERVLTETVITQEARLLKAESEIERLEALVEQLTEESALLTDGVCP